MSKLISRMALTLACIPACARSAAAPTPCLLPGAQYSFCFDSGFEGWTPAAADTGAVGSAYAQWSITSSTDQAFDGRQSLKLKVDNATDAAKIWIVRAFPVDSGRSYSVDVSYEFATAEWGDVNLFTLLTGASSTAPTDGPSLLAVTAQQSTGAGPGPNVGYVWLPKTYHASGVTSVGRSIYVIIGIWGTSEFARTYYVDDVAVTVTPQ